MTSIFLSLGYTVPDVTQGRCQDNVKLESGTDDSSATVDTDADIPGFIILFYYYYLSLILLVTRGIQYNSTFFVFCFLRLNRRCTWVVSFWFKILNSSITDIFLVKKFKIIANQMMSLKQRNFRSKVLVQMMNLITLIAVFYMLYQFHNKFKNKDHSTLTDIV